MLLNVSYRTENLESTFYTWTTEQGGIFPGDPCRDQINKSTPYPSTPADIHHQIWENKRHFLAVLVSNLISDGEEQWMCWSQSQFAKNRQEF